MWLSETIVGHANAHLGLVNPTRLPVQVQRGGGSVSLVAEAAQTPKHTSHHYQLGTERPAWLLKKNKINAPCYLT